MNHFPNLEPSRMPITLPPKRVRHTIDGRAVARVSGREAFWWKDVDLQKGGVN